MVSLTGPDPSDPSHSLVTLSTNDPRWYSLYQVMIAQQAAVTPNQQKHDSYINQLSSYQGSVNAGRGQGMIPPTKPLMTVVDDLGNSTEVPFVPPLPDPVAQPSSNIGTGLGSDSPGRPVTADPNAVLAAHTQILLGIQADLRALKAFFKVA
jgi:hypothetical protein